jgi:hypothetical protein
MQRQQAVAGGQSGEPGEQPSEGVRRPPLLGTGGVHRGGVGVDGTPGEFLDQPERDGKRRNSVARLTPAAASDVVCR